MISFKDNGIGFQDNIDRQKIFGLFKRMHSHVEGLGVGLHIVNSIVVGNEGHIDVKSSINNGAAFRIYL